jgi:hypothetical protein
VGKAKSDGALWPLPPLLSFGGEGGVRDETPFARNRLDHKVDPRSRPPQLSKAVCLAAVSSRATLGHNCPKARIKIRINSLNGGLGGTRDPVRRPNPTPRVKHEDKGAVRERRRATSCFPAGCPHGSAGTGALPLRGDCSIPAGGSAYCARQKRGSR